VEKIMVTWVAQDGRHIEADVTQGHNLMEAAIANNVAGVLGECGGALVCATCHVIVEHTPIELGQLSAEENDMLDMASMPRTPASRLSCQIIAEPRLSGLVLRVPGP